MDYIRNIWKTKELRKKILFVIFAIILFRLVAHIPVPWVDTSALATVFDSSSMLWVFSALTWWSMESFSIVMMGLAPYINASIILQLMVVVIPALEKMKNEEWEEWQKKINMYTRWLAFPLALLQSYWMVALMNMSANAAWADLGINMYSLTSILPIMFTIAWGTIFLMWLWELMTENWIWNWISLIIFAWIISAMPPIIWNIIWTSIVDDAKILPFIIFAFVTLVLLVAIVLFSEAQRNISVTYATAWSRASKWVLPIRLNQAWMIPIIFAIAVVTFPSVAAQFLQNSTTPFIKTISEWILTNLSWSNTSWTYIVIYFLLIMWFTYFYVSVTFKPQQVAENIQKRWGFITWLRPWSQTAEFIEKTSFNLNFWGWGFLAFVAIVPLIFTKYTDLAQSDLLITWSWLIIVVWVVLELIRQINAHLVMQDYDKIK